MNIANDISTLLTDICENIHIDEIPDDNENWIVIFNSGGPRTDFYMGGVKTDKQRLQIRVINKNRQTALDWCEKIKNNIDGKSSFTINNHNYNFITLNGNILNMGRDSRGKAHYAMNFQIERSCF